MCDLTDLELSARCQTLEMAANPMDAVIALGPGSGCSAGARVARHHNKGILQLSISQIILLLLPGTCSVLGTEERVPGTWWPSVGNLGCRPKR